MKKIYVVLLLAVVFVFGGCSRGDEKLIGVEKAKSIALSDAGVSSDTITFKKTSLEWDDAMRIYDIEFYGADNKQYEYEINAETGNIISSDVDGGVFAPGSSDMPLNTPDSQPSAIDEDAAKKIALEKVPGSTLDNIRKFRLEHKDGIKVYSGKIIFENKEYEFEINAQTGKIIEWNSEPIL